MNLKEIYLYLQVLVIRDTRLSYEYMGAAEFEWGSIPHAWVMLSKGPRVTGVTPTDMGFDLHWVAVPTYRPGFESAPVSVDMDVLLHGILSREVRSCERLHLEKFPMNQAHGWLSVDGQVNIHSGEQWRRSTSACRRPCFVAMTSAEGLAQALEKMNEHVGWKPPVRK